MYVYYMRDVCKYSTQGTDMLIVNTIGRIIGKISNHADIMILILICCICEYNTTVLYLLARLLYCAVLVLLRLV